MRALWRLLGFSTITVGGSLASARALSALHITPASGTPRLLVLGAVSALVALAGVWLAGRVLDRRRLGDFGLRLSRAWIEDALFGMLLGGFLMAGVFLVEWGAGWVAVRDTLARGDSEGGFAGAVATLLGVLIFVGFYEELLSRGYLLRNLAEGLRSRYLGPRVALWLATLVSSALFGLLHADNPNATLLSSAAVSCAGVLLALGFLLTGRLALPIGLHVTWNFFQGVVFGFPVSGIRTLGAQVLVLELGGPPAWTGGPFGPEAGLVGLGAMATGCLLIFAWVRWRHGALAVHVGMLEPPQLRHSSPDPGLPHPAGEGATLES